MSAGIVIVYRTVVFHRRKLDQLGCGICSFHLKRTLKLNMAPDSRTWNTLTCVNRWEDLYTDLRSEGVFSEPFLETIQS